MSSIYIVTLTYFGFGAERAVVDDVDGPLGGDHLLQDARVHAAAEVGAVAAVVQVDQEACKQKAFIHACEHKRLC